MPPRRLSACPPRHSVCLNFYRLIHRAQTQPGDKLEFSSAGPPIQIQNAQNAQSGQSSPMRPASCTVAAGRQRGGNDDDATEEPSRHR